MNARHTSVLDALKAMLMEVLKTPCEVCPERSCALRTLWGMWEQKEGSLERLGACQKWGAGRRVTLGVVAY